MKQYLELLQDVLQNGTDKSDRTGTGTKSVFGRQIRFNLADGFPLLTTKKLHFKSIANELIWFLNGDTNAKWLNENGVKIWNAWADENGDLGAIYGKQWTDWNGINQIEKVVKDLKNNPNSRRILFHAWNVSDLPDESLSPQENVANGKMALPPCHLLYQFYAADDKLSTQLYIRSSDSFLGLPYNIASVSLLTTMLAQQCDMELGEVIISIGDLHIYNNHGEQVVTQLQRKPKKLPKLKIITKPKDIFSYKFSDFVIENYIADKHIKAKVSI